MHGRKPTRREKQLIAKYKLQPKNWLVTKSLVDKLVIQHRHTGKARLIPEGVK